MQTLASRQELLESIFENSPNPIFVCAGENLKVTFANSATLSTWQKDPTIIDKPILQAIPELMDGPVPRRLLSVFRTGIDYLREDDLVEIPSGRLPARYFKFTYQSLRTRDGDIWGVLCAGSDVTELAQARKLAEESQQNLQNIIIQAPVAISILRGRAFVIEVANEKMLELWGKPDKIVDMPVFEALPEVEGQGFKELLEGVLDTGVPFSASEIPVILNRGGKTTEVIVNFTYEPIREFKGKITGILVVATDVTAFVKARQQVEESEKEFRQIADAMPQIVWVTKPSGYHDYFNQRWYDYAQMNFEESKGEGWVKAFHPGDVENALVVWRQALASGKTYEVEYRIKNGRTQEYRWFLGRAVPIIDQRGRITRWFGTCTDIHEQKQLLQKKDDFIGIASHELKTPLAALKALLQLMKRFETSAMDERLKMLINQGNNSVNKLASLIEDLLNVSKINQGQLELNKEDFRLADVVSTCCPHIKVEGKQELVIEGDTGVRVFADQQRIEQVLTNFINNAVKYAPESKKITIKIQEKDHFAHVSVTDTGPGIPAEKLPHLFDRYYRAQEHGGQISGLGLGLYISRTIIEKHGGDIGVESTLGKGTTFWFTLPLIFPAPAARSQQ